MKGLMMVIYSNLVWSILCVTLFEIHTIYSGSIAVCTVEGYYGVTWFFVGTTEELDDKTGSVVLSDSGSSCDGSYPFGKTFTNDEFWGLNGQDSELERIKAKPIATSDETCSMCNGHDLDDLFNGAISTWQRKRLKLYDGTYTTSTSSESSIINECESDNNWHELKIVTNLFPGVQRVCFNSTHRFQYDQLAVEYGYDCELDITQESSPSECVEFDIDTMQCVRCMSSDTDTLEYDDSCNATQPCKTYDSETRACLECDLDQGDFILVYSQFPQCWYHSPGTFGCARDENDNAYIEDYYGCTKCDGPSSMWHIPHKNGDRFHYCPYTRSNYSFGNDDCELYRTCDVYNEGDYDCYINPNCDNKNDDGSCDQCKEGYWMITRDHPCRKCPADCGDCQDFVGCTDNGCDGGYDREWDDTCGYWKCVGGAGSGDTEDQQDGSCNIEIAECESSKCSDELDGNPYCHEQNDWGCDYCEDGYFMKSHDYPCVLCEDYLEGCKNGYCEDWRGCTNGGCEDGYKWEWDSDCGYGVCIEDITYSEDGSCNLDLPLCQSSKCSNDDNEHCHEQNDWGCDYCIDGYFMKSHDYLCVSCQDTLEGCMNGYCEDWQGCLEDGCEDGWEWDNVCGVGRCVYAG